MTRRGGEKAQADAPGAPSRYHVLAEVVENASLSGEHHRLTLRAPEIVACVQAGQFLHVWCHPPDEIAQPPSVALLRRPLSISRLRPPDHLELLLRVRGVGGNLLARKVVGDRIDVIGPLGHGFEVPSDLGLAVIVAGGAGVAPVPALVDVLVGQGIRVMTYVGGTDYDRSPFRLDRSDPRNVTIPYLRQIGAGAQFVSECETGLMVTEVFAQQDFGEVRTEVYAIGPRAMLMVLAAVCRGRFPLQVSLEERMACGVGACRSCVIPVTGPEGPGLATVCRDGPVFDAARVDWEHLSDVDP